MPSMTAAYHRVFANVADPAWESLASALVCEEIALARRRRARRS